MCHTVTIILNATFYDTDGVNIVVSSTTVIEVNLNHSGNDIAKET